MVASGVRLEIDKVTHEPVLLYPEGILQLNETAHAIVARCDGLTSVTEIARSLATEYEIAESELERDVVDCLDDLQRQNLIVFAS
jgi:pyrroloquinoline quinone biosynthesis protein D